MTSQELVIRQPPQYGGFEDIQEELDWYGSNPEGVDREHPSESLYLDNDRLPIAQKEEDNDSSNNE